MTQAEALIILKTGANVFLTGEPGSGKTFVTNEYVRYLKSAKVEVAVTASTGIAATHLGGMTLHSWSGIGIKKNLTNYDIDRIASNERIEKRISRTKVLVIDEISMLDGETLWSVDKVCQEIKRNEKPFGGMQIILVGDFFQLPPVSRQGEKVPQFAFLSAVWSQAKPVICYLSEQHRQEDDVFLEILSALRKNKISTEHCSHLQKRCQILPEVDAKKITKLFSHNEDVDRINQVELEKILGKTENFQMSSSGKESLVEQLKRGCLSPENLMLKKDAVVMFTKNSSTGAYVNGTLGTVIGFSAQGGPASGGEVGNPIVKTKSGRIINTEKMDWSIEENNKILAKISQIPLRLAWAMTVHKSQGMSLDSAYMDLRHTFVEGQGYVALSRVKTLSGLYLAGWNKMALKVHREVLACDGEFRIQSTEAREVFGKLAQEEIVKIHENFVVSSGGTMLKKDTPKTNSVHSSMEDKGEDKPKTYSVAKLREKHPNAYKSWREGEDESLVTYFKSGKNTKTISDLMGRQTGSIRARLVKLGLVKEN